MLAYDGCVTWWTTKHNHYTSPQEVQITKYKYFHNHLLTCQNHTTLTQQFLDQEVNSVVWCHGGKYQRSECKPENETSDTCTADYKIKRWRGLSSLRKHFIMPTDHHKTSLFFTKRYYSDVPVVTLFLHSVILSTLLKQRFTFEK